MISPDLSINFGVQAKIASPPMQVAITWGEQEIEYTSAQVAEMYPDLDLSAMGVNFGINYALSELPVNLFGALDPFKKY